MTYLELYWTFFKIGLFTIGGGLAAIPLLQDVALSNGWVTGSAFADMIAVSQSTPGPIGINMATYVGFNQVGILGSVIATLGMVTPSIIVISVISKFLSHFNEHPVVIGVLSGIRPAVIGIICSAAYNIALIAIVHMEAFKTSQKITDLLDPKSLLLFLAFIALTTKWKKHPIVYIVLAGIIGVILF